ncbi:hypothetical protein K2X33_13085 [bacterium]|nr:hypothetical protein [bacterium]
MGAQVWLLGFACFLVLFAYLPLAALFSWVGFYPGPRMLTPGPLWMFAGALPVLVLVVHRALVAPFTNAHLLKKAMPLRKLLPIVALWVLPIASFAYWVGDYRLAVHALDISLLLFAAFAIPVALFWRTGERGILSIGIGLFVFASLFVVDDILGPLSPLWVYAAEGTQVYTVRTLCCGLAVALAIFSPLSRSARATALNGLYRLALGFLALGSAGAAVAAWFGDSTAAGLVSPNLNAIGYLGLLYFYGRMDVFGQKAFLLVSGVVQGALMAQALFIFWSADASVEAQLTLFTNTLGVFLNAWEVRRRLRLAREGRDFISRVRSAPVPSDAH